MMGSRTPADRATNPLRSGCACCAPQSVSRRQFLCSTAAVAAAAPAIVATATEPAFAQAPPPAQSTGRPVLIKNGCVVSLDRAVGDFEQADVLVRGTTIAEIRPTIVAADAEVIDA